MKTRGIAGIRSARRAGAVWGVLFLAAAACGPAFPATLEWGTYLGGSGNDYARGVALDGDGNLYVVGDTASAGWVSGGGDTTFNDGVSTLTDAFLVKLSPAGAHLWSTYLGGSGEEFGYGVALDGDGNILIAGKTKSSGWMSDGWDTAFNNGVTTSYTDGFLVKLSSAGAHVWSTYLGGNSNDGAKAVAVDADGNVLVAGETDSSTPWVSGGWNVSPGGTDGFAVKLSPGGAHLWSTYLGGTGADGGNAIAVDTDGNVLAVGTTEATSNWVSGGWDTVRGGQDGFLVKLSALGAHEWSTYLGGANSDAALGVGADGGGNVVVCGDTWSPGWVSGGAFTAYFGSRDGFVARFSPSGGHAWSSYFGGDKADYFEALALDAGGDAYVSGTTQSPGWVSGGWDTVVNSGGTTVYDGVVLRLSAAGAPVWSSYIGGLSFEYGHGVAVAADGTVVVAGETHTAGWVAGGYDTIYDGGKEGFVVRADQTAERGALRVTLTPPEAVAAGAQWRLINTSAWYDSGAELSGISAGERWVEFKQAGDWAAPLPLTVTVAAGTTTEASAAYAPAGALRVAITPADVVSAGARWRRVGTTAWHESGATEEYVPAGDVQVEFNTVAGWISPSARSVTVAAGATAELAAAYTDNRSALRVTITPQDAVAAGALWRRVGTTAWLHSETVESSVVPGDYQVEFKTLDYWVAPSVQTVTVTAGTTAEATGEYGPAGAMTVALTPAEAVTAGARWRRVGTTTWCTNGATEFTIPVGDHQVEFKAVSNWTTPPVQSVTVMAGETLELVAVYTTNPPGTLRVTITPPEAVAAGAKWRRVGTITWRASGATEADVPVGDYQVEFKAVAGWIAPPAQPVTVAGGVTAELAASYTDNRGALRVTLAPPEAVAAGAQWRRVGTTPWFDSGATETGIPAGTWQVELKTVSGWAPPAVQTATVTAGTTKTAFWMYTPLGALRVTITPAEVVQAGARWRRVGTSTWRESGTTETGIPEGFHQVEFTAVSGWITPSTGSVFISAGRTTEVSPWYTDDRGIISVLISPAEAVAAGAQWRRVGTATWLDSGAEEGLLPSGGHNVEFKTVAGWVTPPVQTVRVLAGRVVQAEGRYAPAGSLRVTIAPAEAVAAGAQWRRVGTATWRSSGTVESGIPAGDYQVEFKAVADWITPSAHPVTVAAGETAELAASYTDNRGSLRVTITPADAVAAGAKWRRVGTTTWLISGSVESSVLPGDHQVEFMPVKGWIPPPAQPVTVTLGTIAEVLGEYAPVPAATVVINGGAGSTNTTEVTLTLTWSHWAGFEVRRMRFSNDGATWSPWEPLAATRAWTLREGDGYKTVRVQFLDRAGNYSDRFSDYIRLDTTPPTGTIVINNNQPAALSPEVTLSLTWDDAGGSGVRRMRFSDNGSTWSPWEPLSATRVHTLPATPGYHTVRVTYRDAAGNVSERFADYIRLDLP